MINKLKEQIISLVNGGFFHILFGNTLAKMVAFISSIVIVRLVSKEDYAYLAYADNLYSYVNLFAGLGLSTAVLKFCTGNKMKQGEDKAYMMFAMKYGNLFQLLISLVIVVYVYNVKIPFPAAKPLVVIMVLYPTLTNTVTTIQNYIRAHLNNKLYVKISVVQTIVVFLASVVLVILIGVEGIVFARYVALVLAILISWKFLKTMMRGVETQKLDKNQIKAFMAMAISMMIANFFSSMLANNELALVNYLVSDEVATANYKVANLIPSQLTFITSSIVVYYFPIVSRIDNMKEAWRKMKKIGILTGALIFVTAIAFMLISPFIIRIAYGDRYMDATNLFQLFWIVYAINAGVRMIPLNMLPAIGITKFNAGLSFVTCVVHLVIDYVFIITLGITGAGIASAIVYLFSGLIGWIYLYKVCMKKAENNCDS